MVIILTYRELGKNIISDGGGRDYGLELLSLDLACSKTCRI
jgi:hypothetical protein